MATDCPWKLPPLSRSPVVEHERIVGGRIELAPDHARREVDRVEHGAVHLRHAAQRVRVLHARVVVAVRLADLAVGEQLAQTAPPTRPGRAGRAHPECARRRRRACRATPRATSRPRRAPRARAGAHRRARAQPIAVCACVPLISVSPFFRTERRPARARRRRSMSAAGPRVAAATERAFADQRQREMRERREIAARADAALLRDGRIEPGVEHRREQLDQVESRAGESLRDDVRAQQHHRAHFALREQRRPTPAAWLRTRLTCSSASRSGGMATSDSLPKPVVTP